MEQHPTDRLLRWMIALAAIAVGVAAALRRSGGSMEFEPLLREAARRGAEPEARSFAALVLAEVLGEKGEALSMPVAAAAWRAAGSRSTGG